MMTIGCGDNHPFFLRVGGARATLEGVLGRKIVARGVVSRRAVPNVTRTTE
jgi:hypothetical protein